MIQRKRNISHTLELEELVLIDGHTTQSNIQIQCNSYKNPHDIFHGTRANNPKIYMEPQKTQNCQSNPEEKELSWRHNPFTLNSTKLQSETVW